MAAKRAGSNLVYSTKIGKDSFAEIARASFAENAISMDYVFETEKAATGAALISVDEVTSQNEIIVILGASATYEEEDLESLRRHFQAVNTCFFRWRSIGRLQKD